MIIVHSWGAYDLAKEIVQTLLEGGLIEDKDVLMVRGIIQIKMEE